MRARVFIPARVLEIARFRRVAADHVVIQYGVTHWNVVAVHGQTGRRAVLGQLGSIGPAIDLAVRSGLPVLLGPGAAGWAPLLRARA